MATEGAVVALLQNLLWDYGWGVETPSTRVHVECNLEVAKKVQIASDPDKIPHIFLW